ncbi:hypothetical protein LCGC14_2847130 [marine sediment metagenome]|uniref:Uncharacterized protein n=1 Tax=marine sediment metagenome TaxID=412755 RepID=A0A0F9B0I4_9ZZZZ
MSGNHNSGRKPKYVTIEKFDDFIENHFTHLKKDVATSKWTIRVVLGATIVWALIDRLFGG